MTPIQEDKIISEAWIFHKGLTFTRRTSSSKRLKDLYGIWYVTTQLGNFSEQVIAAFHILARQHAKWFQTFQKQLSNWVDHASPEEWSQLESQDPSGKLKKLGFEKSARLLLASI